MSAALEERVDALCDWLFSWTTFPFLTSPEYVRELGPQAWSVTLADAGCRIAQVRMEAEWHGRGYFLVGTASRIADGEIRWHGLGCGGAATDEALDARLTSALDLGDTRVSPFDAPPSSVADRARWSAEREVTRARLVYARDFGPAVWRVAGVGWMLAAEDPPKCRGHRH